MEAKSLILPGHMVGVFFANCRRDGTIVGRVIMLGDFILEER